MSGRYSIKYEQTIFVKHQLKKKFSIFRQKKKPTEIELIIHESNTGYLILMFINSKINHHIQCTTVSVEMI